MVLKCTRGKPHAGDLFFMCLIIFQILEEHVTMPVLPELSHGRTLQLRDVEFTGLKFQHEFAAVFTTTIVKN